MKRALLFPGQGSQFVGMGRELFDSDPAARTFLEKADAALPFQLSRMILEGPEEELKKTAITQPAILTVSVAFGDYLKRRDFNVDYVAGHSLGEYSALVHSGAITFEDAVRMVHLRGKFMQEAVPLGEGAMAAVMGLSGKDVEAICKEASSIAYVAAANFNAPTQTVISGTPEGVEKAQELAKERGARRVIPLNVSAPFHCDLMKPAQVRMKAVLDNVTFNDPVIPLVTNADAAVIRTGEAAREALLKQVTHPVRWVESVKTMTEEGVTTFYETAPGKVLTGLVRRINREVEAVSLAAYEDLQSSSGGDNEN